MPVYTRLRTYLRVNPQFEFPYPDCYDNKSGSESQGFSLQGRLAFQGAASNSLFNPEKAGILGLICFAQEAGRGLFSR